MKTIGFFVMNIYFDNYLRNPFEVTILYVDETLTRLTMQFPLFYGFYRNVNCEFLILKRGVNSGNI